MYSSQHLVFSKSSGSNGKIDNTTKPVQPAHNAINIDKSLRINMPLM